MAPKTQADWQKMLDEMTIETRNFINGRYRDAEDGATFARICPFNGAPVANIARSTANDVDMAVHAAKTAFADGRWRGLAPAERKSTLLRFADLIRANAEELALLETVDVGKPVSDAMAADVPAAAGCIQFYAEAIDKLYDEVAPTGNSDMAVIKREPLGVIGAVVPWNYPQIIAAWKIGPALAVGNSVVLKPAEQSSLATIRLAGLAKEAGIPDGVLNVVTGYGEETGKPLALHPDVNMIAFTGSSEVGKLIAQYGATTMKRVALECGGKSPQVVFDDGADLDAAAEAIAWSVFYNTGQTCHAGTRVIVQSSVRDTLVEKVGNIAKSLKQGHPLDPETQIGAMIDKGQMEKVLSYIDHGQSDGATCALGGRQALTDTGGFFVEPTILTGVKNDMKVAREEIFGPVISVIDFETEEEALAIADDTDFGLAGSVWTADMNRAKRLSDGITAGTVWVNTYDMTTMSTPFGGFKESGYGRDRSVHAVDKYTDQKTVWWHFS